MSLPCADVSRLPHQDLLHVGHMTLNMSITIATANARALLEPNPAKAVSTRMSGETEIVGSHCTWIIPLV
eukprot:4568709-Lingulodinium_polyedra.AAC.1